MDKWVGNIWQSHPEKRSKRPPKWYDRHMGIKKGTYVRRNLASGVALGSGQQVTPTLYSRASSDSRQDSRRQIADYERPDVHDVDSHVIVDYKSPQNSYTNWNGTSNAPFGQAVPQFPKQPEQGQQQLFAHHYSPAQATVTSMGGMNTTSAKIAGINMLGIAQNDAMKRGLTLDPAVNLSEHSARLVEKLKGSGAVDKDFVREAENSSPFWDKPDVHTSKFYEYPHGEAISSGEVNMGESRARHTIRSIQGRKKDARQAAQEPEQLSFDGY